MMTKQEIKAEAHAHGYTANYDSRNKRWYFRRFRQSNNSRAFDGIVFANLTRRLGIENQVEEITK